MRRWLVGCAAAALCLATVPAMASAPANRFAGTIVSKRIRHYPNRILALTFDDGPSPDLTPRILSTLTTYHARATFFVLGPLAARHPELVRRAVAAGNEIGVHGWSHKAHLSDSDGVREVSRTIDVIRKVTGQTPHVLRPPYGLRHSSIAREGIRRHMAVILWTISSADTCRVGPDVLANNVIHTPYPGDIILMHDGAGHRATAAAVPAILRTLTAQGYRFVTVSELLDAWSAWHPTPAGPRGPARKLHSTK